MKSRKLFKFQKVGKGFPNSSLDKEPTCSAEDPSLIPRSGRYPEEGIGNPLQYSWASLVAQLVKNLPAMQRPGEDVGKIPQRREKLPTPVLWPGEFHGVTTSQTQLSDCHLIPILLQLFPKIEKEETLSNSFYQVSNTLIPTPYKKTSKK